MDTENKCEHNFAFATNVSKTTRESLGTEFHVFYCTKCLMIKHVRA